MNFPCRSSPDFCRRPDFRWAYREEIEIYLGLYMVITFFSFLASTIRKVAYLVGLVRVGLCLRM